MKVEHEGDGLTDEMLQEWGPWMDAQIERKFGSDPPPLVASTLNFSRNEIGDEGVRLVCEYLQAREISVQMVKFFKNSIGDAGAWAIGQLLAHAREPVHEVHMSHNLISEQGALSIFESIARSKRYPYHLERAGRRDSQGLTPVWLRMEYNCIRWALIEGRLEQTQIRWCAADSRDGWGPKDTSPMVCMHTLFRSQKLDGPSLGVGGGQASSSRGRAVQSPAMQPVDPPEEELDVDGGAEEVPMYMFLDASAVRRFAADKGSAKERLFTFQGLLNLCQQGHMECTPPNDVSMPQWLGPVEERDRIVMVITDTVLEELASIAEHSPNDRRQMEWLTKAPDSYLKRSHQWGILEVLETAAHTQLIKLAGWEQRAKELRISRWALRNLDFACLWDSQIDSPGKVLFVTGDDSLCTFAAEAARTVDGLQRVAVAHVHKIDRVFASDREHGGHRLYEAAQRPKANKFCGACLSAQIMTSLVLEPALAAAVAAASPQAADPSLDLLAALQEAQTLLSEVRPVVEFSTHPDAAKWVERVDRARERWQATIVRHAQ